MVKYEGREYPGLINIHSCHLQISSAEKPRNEENDYISVGIPRKYESRIPKKLH